MRRPVFGFSREAMSGEEAVALSRTLEPDVVLMDLTMPGIGGVEATRKITADRAARLVVLLSSYRERDLPDEARACGRPRTSPRRGLGGEYSKKFGTATALVPLLRKGHKHRRDPPVYVRLPGKTELLKDRVDVLLDRLLSDDERRRYRCVVLPPGHFGEGLELARCERFEGSVLTAGGDERIDDLRVDGGTACGDLADRGHELVQVIHPFLEQVGERSEPCSSRATAYSGSENWLSTTTPVSGCVSRSRSAAWIPSSRPPGPILMSVTTTSGRAVSTASSSESRSSACRYHLEVALRLEEAAHNLRTR